MSALTVSTKRRLLILLALLAALLVSCSTEARGGYSWGWFRVSPFTEAGQRNIRFLLRGYIPTLTVSFASWGVSIALGLALAVFGLAKNRALVAINRGYILVFRSIPVLVMILWVYYGLPVSLGIDLSVFASAVVALSLCDAAFEAEIFRSGIESIDNEQLESARTLGSTTFQTYRYIILPQAIRRILPPLANQFIFILKVSSLVSVIGFGELTRRANELNVSEYRPLEIYTVLIIEYLLIILVATWLVRRLEKALATY